MSHIVRRVSRLEDAAGVRDKPPRSVVRIIVKPEEDEDDMLARWRAEHPAAPEDVFFIVRKLVSPQREAVAS